MKAVDHVRRAVAEATPEDCWIWPKCVDRKGYGVLNNAGVRTLAHRLACEMFHGPAPEGKPVVAHSCGKRDCINPRHLRWATYAENERDKIGHGRSNRGEGNGHAILTVGDVRSIRRRCAKGEAHTKIAKSMNVSRSTVGDIATRKTWAWLT